MAKKAFAKVRKNKETMPTKSIANAATNKPVSTKIASTRKVIASLAIEPVQIQTKAKNKAKNDFTPTLVELNAMPESDYMSAAQLRYFKSVLDGMRADILANSDATSETLRENVVVPDPADRATIEEEHAIELRTRDRERKLLKKITQALEAIEQGEYGWCEETGDAIGLRRLLARPTATLSLEAQQRRELKQKMYGD